MYYIDQHEDPQCHDLLSFAVNQITPTLCAVKAPSVALKGQELINHEEEFATTFNMGYGISGREELFL